MRSRGPAPRPLPTCPVVRHRGSAAGAAIAAVAGMAPSAEAHEGGTGGPGQWGSAWNADPLIVGSLLTIAWLYARGWRRLAARPALSLRRPSWQAAAFAAGMALLVLALLSPLDPLSEELSSAHMVQHMILMNLAAPLLMLGSTSSTAYWGLSLPWRRALGRWQRTDHPSHRFWTALRIPLAVTLLYGLVLWLWHLPGPYTWALRDAIVHDIQHLTFFAAGCLFWRLLLDPRNRHRWDAGTGVLVLFVTSLHSTILGALMALSPHVWYPDYIGRTQIWGWAPLEDQQLAGLIMWMPACMVYAVAAAGLLAVWLQSAERLPGEGPARGGAGWTALSMRSPTARPPRSASLPRTATARE
jgi:putative membrane protein